VSRLKKGTNTLETQDRPTAMLISAAELAGLMNVSERTLWRLLSADKVPKPVRFGRNTRWRLAEVRDWIDRGCPSPRG
jgi:predicted DNA-binding transcriptional regulator AlpA